MPASATYPAIDSFKTVAILFQVQISPAVLGVPLQCLLQQCAFLAKPARLADEVCCADCGWQDPQYQ